MSFALHLIVLILHAPPAFAIPEAATAARAPLAAEVRRLGTALVLAHATADAEQDGGNQEAGHGGPSKSVAVLAQLGRLIVAAKDVATLDSPRAVKRLC